MLVLFEWTWTTPPQRIGHFRREPRAVLCQSMSFSKFPSVYYVHYFHSFLTCFMWETDTPRPVPSKHFLTSVLLSGLRQNLHVNDKTKRTQQQNTNHEHFRKPITPQHFLRQPYQIRSTSKFFFWKLIISWCIKLKNNNRMHLRKIELGFIWLDSIFIIKVLGSFKVNIKVGKAFFF